MRLHLALAAVLLLLLVVWADRVDAGSRCRSLAPGRRRGGLRRVARQPRSDVPPGAGHRALRADRAAGHPAPAEADRRVCRWRSPWPRPLLYAYLPYSLGDEPAARLRQPGDVGWLPLPGLRRAVPRHVPAATRLRRRAPHDRRTRRSRSSAPFAPLALVGPARRCLASAGLMLLLAAWFAVNWFFALGYVNADIGRYYLVPLLAAAVLGGLGAGRDRRCAHLARGSVLRSALHLLRSSRPYAVAIAVDRGDAVAHAVRPGRFRRCRCVPDQMARAWLDGVMTRLPQERCRRLVVELLDHAVVRPVRGASAAGRDRRSTTRRSPSRTWAAPIDVIDSYLGRASGLPDPAGFDLPELEQRYVSTPLPGISAGRSTGRWHDAPARDPAGHL